MLSLGVRVYVVPFGNNKVWRRTTVKVDLNGVVFLVVDFIYRIEEEMSMKRFVF